MKEEQPIRKDSAAVGCRPADRLVAKLYDEIHRLAVVALGDQRGGDAVLQPTMLVHEVYLKLAGAKSGAWNDDAHFLATAAKAARHVVVDHARAMGRQKRGDGATILGLKTRMLGGRPQTLGALDLEDALQALEREDPRAAAIAELRFFGGFTIEQTAMRMELSTATVEREWRFARAWLHTALFGEPASPGRE